MDISKKKKGNDKQAWVDWLSDEPPAPGAQAELRQKRVTNANMYVPRSQQAQQAKPVTPAAHPTAPQAPYAGVLIQVNLPQFKKPQIARTKAAWKWVRTNATKKQVTAVAAVVLVLTLSWVGAKLTYHKVHHKDISEGASLSSVTSSTPDFTPVVPSDKEKLATADGKNSRYDPMKKNYSYLDSIGGKQFTVSQQSLASNAEAERVVPQAAKSLNATVPLKTGWGTAYKLTNQKYNSQTLVVGVNNIMVFLQSSFVFTDDQWITYINSLQ